MKKLIFTVATLLLIATQGNTQIEVGATLGVMHLPVSKTTSNLMGASVLGKYELVKTLRVGASFGYYNQSVSTNLSSFVIPMMASVDYKYSKGKFAPFGGLELGMYRMGISATGFGSLATNNLAFVPMIGCDYEITKQINITTNIKYNYVMTSGSSISGLGFNLGLAYKL